MERGNNCWRQMLMACMEQYGETFANVVGNTMTDEEMDALFDSGYGGSEGIPFTCWTSNRVYFPVVYDGSEWVGSVPRHPNGEATSHHGGQ